MKNWLPISLLAALGAALGVQSARADQPVADVQQPKVCTLTSVEELDMSTESDGEVAVPFKIGDQAVNLVVDTGSVLGSLSYEAAWGLHLQFYKLDPDRFSFVGKIKVEGYATATKTAIGRVGLGEQDFLLVPDNMLDKDQDGILGPSIFSRFDVDFDFAAGKFRLFLQDHCPGHVVYWTRGGYAAVPMRVDRFLQIRVPVVLDGKEVTALIDTGSYRSSIPASLAASLFGITPKTPGNKALDKININGNGEVQAYRYPFGHMSFGGVTVNNPDLIILPDEMLGQRPVVLLGISILRQLHLYIAYKEQMLYVTPAQPVEPAPALVALPASTPSSAAGDVNAKLSPSH